MVDNETNQSSYFVNITWTESPNNPDFLKLNSLTQKGFELSLVLTVTPLDIDRIIAIYPGLDEDSEGLNRRYQFIANQMQKRSLGAVVRCGNPKLEPFLPITHLRQMLNFVIGNSNSICNHPTPELLLMGFSAGASAVAALASYYERVSRLLLVAPSGDIPKEFVESSLRRFTGEVYILIGADDEIVDRRSGQIYYDLALAASYKELIVIENCGHYFQKEINDMIFKEAPFYAFAEGEKSSFPPTYSI